MAHIPSRKEAEELRKRSVEARNSEFESVTESTSFGEVVIIKELSGSDRAKYEKWTKQSQENLRSAKKQLLKMLEDAKGKVNIDHRGGYTPGQLTNGQEEWSLNGQEIANMTHVIDYGPDITSSRRLGLDATSKTQAQTKWYEEAKFHIFDMPVLENEYKEFTWFVQQEVDKRSAK